MNNQNLNEKRAFTPSASQVYGRAYSQQAQTTAQQPIFQQPQRPYTNSFDDIKSDDIKPKRIFSMLDKKVIIPLVIIIILLVSGFVFFQMWRASSESSSKKMSVAEQEEETVQRVLSQNIKQKTWLAQKTDACLVLGSGRDECLFNLTTTFNKPTLCSKISNKRGSFSSDSCYEEMAVKNYNSKFCNFINPSHIIGENTFYSCIFKTARVTDAPRLCLLLLDEEEIDGEELRYTKPLCISQFNMSMTEFKRIYEPER